MWLQRKKETVTKHKEIIFRGDGTNIKNEEYCYMILNKARC